VASYSAVINVSVSGQAALDKLEGSARSIQTLIQGIKQQKNIFDESIGSQKTRELKKNLDSLVTSFAAAKDGARQFEAYIGGRVQTVNMYSKTLAGLSHQLGTFRAISDNATVGTDRFVNSLIAANKVSNELARTQASAMTAGTGVTGTPKNVQEVLALGKAIPNTIEGLNFYKGKLEELLSTLRLTSNEFRAVEEASAAVDARLGNARLTGQTSAITPAAGPASRIDTVASYEKRAALAQKVADLEYKQLLTGQQLATANITETQQKELQNRLAQASEALAKGELDVAKRLTNELRNQRILYERGAKTSSPVELETRRNNILNSTQMLEQKALQLKTKGVNVDKQINSLQALQNSLRAQGVNLTEQDLGLIDEELNGLRNVLKLENTILGTRKAQANATKAAAAPGEQEAKNKNAMLQNALIGGAFPLLFGGGAGAVVGGFAGGFISDNPMMSIVTSVLGTMVDEFAAAAIAVGAALMDTATTFDVVKEKSLFSSKELEKYATKLQEAGFVASASAVAQFDIIRKVGNKGVEDLATLASESDKLNRAFAELTVQMQAFIAGPLAVLLEQMAAVVGQTTTAQRAKVLEENLRAQGKTADADKLANRVQGAQVKGLGQSFNFSNFDPLNPLSLVAPNTKAIGNINEEIQGIINEFEKIELKPKIKLTPEQINKQDLAVLEKRLEAISIGKSLTDAVKQAAREQKDLDKQRADLVRSYEESIGSIRKKVEDEVSRRRFSTLEKENQLLDLQGQNRIKQLQAANAQEIALAGRGERSEVASVAKEVAQIVADFTEQQLSAEEEAAKIKRNAALDARKFDFEAAQFKANIEKEVAKLNIETARKVADINEKVRSKNEETDSRKFDIEKRIAQIKLTIIETELKLAARAPDLEPQVRRNTEIMANIIGDMIKKNENMQPPAPLRGVGQVGGGGVSTTNFDAIVSKEKNAIQALVDEALKGIDLTAEQIGVTLTSRLQTVADGIDKALADIETREADLEVSRLRRIELVNAGLTEGVIQRVMELEQLKKIALAQYDIFIAQLESKIITEGVTTEIARQNAEYVRQIELIQQRKDALEGNLGTFDATTGTGTGAIGNAITSQAGKQIQEFITTTTTELNNLEQVAINVSTGIGNAIGNSLANGIMGLIEGTATAKEVFATFLRDVGQILIQEGTKMIAMYIAIGIAKIFAGLGGGGGNAASALGSNPNVAAYAPLPAGAKGATFANGIATFAKGGTFSNSIVSSPTLFKFADGGTTRTGLMGEAGPEAIMPLKRGADGSLGVQANGLREAMNQDRAGGSGSPVLNMSFQSTSINGTEYVSRDQLEQAMEQTRRDASRDGAKRGMTMTLDKLQQSPSTRSRVGMR
jgi:phage-related minor tail protein